MRVGFGKNIRKQVVTAQKKSSNSYMCPNCSRKAVRRKAAGIWCCKKCQKVFASGPYEFKI